MAVYFKVSENDKKNKVVVIKLLLWKSVVVRGCCSERLESTDGSLFFFTKQYNGPFTIRFICNNYKAT